MTIYFDNKLIVLVLFEHKCQIFPAHLLFSLSYVAVPETRTNTGLCSEFKTALRQSNLTRAL